VVRVLEVAFSDSVRLHAPVISQKDKPSLSRIYERAALEATECLDAPTRGMPDGAQSMQCVRVPTGLGLDARRHLPPSNPARP
jgi:hypothetical protein